MKKIVFLIAHLGGGGAERVTVSLANNFSKDNYNVTVIVFSKKYDEYKLDDDVHVEYLPSRDSKVSDVYEKTKALKQYIADVNPDYVCSLGFSYRFVLLSGLLSKYKFVYSERNDPRKMYNKIDYAIVKYCLRKSYRVVFQTEEAKNIFSKSIQDKSTVIANPLKDNLPAAYHGKREKRIIAFSRLNKQKNIPLMLRAFKSFHENFPEYKLEIYGRGEIEDELKKYADNLGISEWVDFKGFNPDVHSAIIKARCFLSTSDYEGISNSMLESLAIGLPCICTDCPVGGAAMFVRNGTNGFLVPVNDEKAIVEKLNLIATDDALVTSLSINAEKIRDILSLESICEQWKNIMG